MTSKSQKGELSNVTLSHNVKASNSDPNQDDTFTLVSYKKKGSAARAAEIPSVQTRAATKGTNQLVITLSTFGKFHQHIFPILQKICVQQNLQLDPFVVTWRKLTTTHNPKVTATTSFRILAKALGIGTSDIKGYKHNLLSCLTISDYITISDDGSTVTGFSCVFKTVPTPRLT